MKGIEFGNIISCLFVVVSLIETECAKINMEISESKSKTMRIGKPINKFENGEEPFRFDQVLTCKYLGVIIDRKTSEYFVSFAQNCVKKSKMYKFSIMTKSKDSYDPPFVARELWTKTAIPSILYGSETVPLRQQELRKLNSDAASIGKFILQLPKTTSNITATLIAGERIYTLIWFEHDLRVLKYT